MRSNWAEFSYNSSLPHYPTPNQANQPTPAFRLDRLADGLFKKNLNFYVRNNGGFGSLVSTVEHQLTWYAPHLIRNNLVPVGQRSGGRLAMTLVATINVITFSFFFSFLFSPSSTFLIEGVLRSKNLFSESCLERPKTFPVPLCHFGAPWRPFWILQAVRRCRRLASAPFAARLVLA